ncbi:hypothetical protein FSP39_003165 [Pinctada imbricata]|uniref:Cysteine protease n=1 Tax=Pinctada imbricata TaxID=66713 RepID=A0AA89C0C1_PINIB|nr:hypothetical protein FSP39_003165 [Pinctada imbricata]
MKRSSGYKIRRKISEDVSSLDSWSEALSPEPDSPSGRTDDQAGACAAPVALSTQSGLRRRFGSGKSDDKESKEKKTSSHMILDPSKLTTIPDPSRNKPNNEEDLIDVIFHADRDQFYIENDVEIDYPYSSFVNDAGPCYSSLPETFNSQPSLWLSNPSIQQESHSAERHTATSIPNGLYSWPSSESIGARTFPPRHKLVPPKMTNTQTLEDGVDQTERMKNKVKSFLNNMKYGWTIKTKTSFRFDSPIWMLGECYHIRPSDIDAVPGNITRRMPTIEKFKQQFCSLLWFTYRQDFPAIPGTKLTTDCGWGCMLRSGQMMLAKAFSIHYLGRDWNVFSNQTREQDTYRKQIIRWFGDYPSEESPFGMHKLVEVGKSHGKQPGEWYGPSSVAHIFKATMNRGYSSQIVLTDICIYVAQDCTVYKQDIYNMCCSRVRSETRFTSSSESNAAPSSADCSLGEWQRAVVIFIPVRLGGEELNPLYIPCIKSLLAQDSCIGIIGGKPKHSLYFVGWQEEKLIYLDPHYCQDAVDTRERDFPIQSFHCLSPRKLSVSKMDPSCTIGFYCRTRADFEKFVVHVEEMVSPPKQKLSYPMFVFSDGESEDVMYDDFKQEKDKVLRIRHVRIDSEGRVRSETLESEEFVVL